MDDGPGVLGAVDIGATKTLLAVLPTTLDVTSPAFRDALRRPIRIMTDRDPDEHAARVAQRLRATAGDRRLLAVGVAAPGPLDPATGTVVHSPNLGWRHHPLGPALSEALCAPVVLEDDANAGALGEALAGAGRDADPVAYLTLSTGVGAGIIVDGRIVHGAHHAAGEVGHFTVDPAGPRCGCGGRGHVEAYVGGASLTARARTIWPSGRRADGSPSPSDAPAILAAAQAGDAAAERVVAEAIEAVAVALAVLAASVDPARIVVGGSIGLGQRRMVRRATTLARRRVIRSAGRDLTVVPAILGPLAPLIGAAVLALRASAEGELEVPFPRVP